VSNLAKFSIGQVIRSLPGHTWNALVDGEHRDRQLANWKQVSRVPSDQSPVIVRLFWNGAAPLPPGSVVALDEPMFDPGDFPSAPFYGLSFRATTPDVAEPNAAIAITLGVIDSVGCGCIAGASWVKLTITDEMDNRAKLISSTMLESVQIQRFATFSGGLIDRGG